MRKLFFTLLIILIFSTSQLYAQDLDQILNELSDDKTPTYTFGTFQGTSIINGQSVEVPGNADLHFVLSHRFGAVNQGIYNFFGIDQATTRFGFEYGIRDLASLSIGRNGFNKTYDGAVKLRVLRQQTGIRNIPLNISLYSSFFINTYDFVVPDHDYAFVSRLSYTSQILIARKFSKKLSIQLSPSYVHKNLVPRPEDQNNIFAIGIGGRYKLFHRLSFNAEYFYLLPGETANDFNNSLSFGLDIGTGGHVFQLEFTNSQSTFARGFITETQGEWLEGDIYFGFNLYRVFPLNKKAKNIY